MGPPVSPAPSTSAQSPRLGLPSREGLGVRSALGPGRALGGWSCVRGGMGWDREDRTLCVLSSACSGGPSTQKASGVQNRPGKGGPAQARCLGARERRLSCRDKGHRLPRDQTERNQEDRDQGDNGRFTELGQPEVVVLHGSPSDLPPGLYKCGHIEFQRKLAGLLLYHLLKQTKMTYDDAVDPAHGSWKDRDP